MPTEQEKDAALIAAEEERRKKFADKTAPKPAPKPPPPKQKKSFLEGLKEDILFAIKGE